MKSDIIEVKKEAQTLTDQKMVLKGTFVEENVALIDDVMVASQDSSEKAVQRVVFLNLGVGMNVEEANLVKLIINGKLVISYCF